MNPPETRRHRTVLTLIVLLSTASLATPRAMASPLHQSAVDSLDALPLARLVGGSGGGGGSLSYAPTGFFLGGGAGLTVAPASRSENAQEGLGFGLTTGFQFPSGLALLARFDDFGITRGTDGDGVLGAAGGLRYVLPTFPMPFAEVLTGPVFVGSQASLGVELGLGAAIPVVRHVAIEVSARDWIVGLDGAVRQLLEFQVGLTIGFGGHHH